MAGSDQIIISSCGDGKDKMMTLAADRVDGVIGRDPQRVGRACLRRIFLQEYGTS